MRIGAERDRQACLARHLDNLAAGVDLLAILAQPSGVQLHGHARFSRRFDKLPEERRTILFRIEAELLAQVRVGDDVSVENYTGETISVLQMYRDYYRNDKSKETLIQHLNAPIAIRARRQLEKELQSYTT